MGLIRKSNKRGGDFNDFERGNWIKKGPLGTAYKFIELDNDGYNGYKVVVEDRSDPSKRIKLSGQASEYNLALFGNSSGGKKMTRKTKKGGKRMTRKTKKGGKRMTRKTKKGGKRTFRKSRK